MRSEFVELLKTLRILMSGVYLCRGVVIAVHILPKEGDLFDTLIFELFYFGKDGLYVATALSASDKRHDAEGTHVVASPHYRYKSSD